MDGSSAAERSRGVFGSAFGAVKGGKVKSRCAQIAMGLMSTRFAAIFDRSPKLDPMLFRYHGFPDDVEEPIWFYSDDSNIKSHPDYVSAKSGEIPAAVRLVSDLGIPLLASERFAIPPGACFVSPHAREATGDNAIPQVLAEACAMVFHGEADVDLVQISRVFHTGADPMERRPHGLSSRALWCRGCDTCWSMM